LRVSGRSMGRLAGHDWRTCVRFLSALSLILVAFAHQPLEASRSDIPDASAYALPDGSIPVICVTLPGVKGDAHIAHGLPCGACLVASSILVPTPAEIPGPSVEPGQSVVYASADLRIERSAFPPSAPPQAPPLA
jgi:hypothetical protein